MNSCFQLLMQSQALFPPYFLKQLFLCRHAHQKGKDIYFNVNKLCIYFLYRKQQVSLNWSLKNTLKMCFNLLEIR